MNGKIGFLIFIIGLAGIMLKEFFTNRNKKNNSKTEEVNKLGIHTSQYIPAGSTVELWRFQVPSKCRLIIARFANYINEPDAWGLITWRLKRNGVGMYPYSKIEDQLGYASQLAFLDGVECSGGDLFVVDATNNYGDVVKVGIVLRYELWGVN